MFKSPIKNVNFKSATLGVFIIFLFFNFSFAQELPREGRVYVCPLATKMEEINPKCECRIDLILGETVTSNCPLNNQTYEMILTITEHEGKEYYAILGFENGGAGVNFEPVANPGGPYRGETNQEILFDGSSSFDSNSDPLDFYWDFGDGNLGFGINPTHIYSFPGTYIVKLTVDDGMFNSQATTTIDIFEAPTPRKNSGQFVLKSENEKPQESTTSEIIEEKPLTEEKPLIEEKTTKETSAQTSSQFSKDQIFLEKGKPEKKLIENLSKEQPTPQNFFAAALSMILEKPNFLIFSLIFSLIILISALFRLYKRKKQY